MPRGGYSGGSGDSAAQWEADWRKGVSDQLKQSGDALQAASLTLARLSDRLDEHDRRIEALEAQPATARANNLSDRAQSIMLGSLLVSLLALLVSILHGGPITIP